ncbi:MAG: carboxylesterase family protein [Prevotella sp.]|jgi:predicted esterase|nr:carboxylesterase family protein [Prevotella sp.]
MKRNIIPILLLIIISCLAFSCNNKHRQDADIQIEEKADIDKQTYVYSIKGGDTLRLDKYNLPDNITRKPCVIYVFGGGFMQGSRLAAHYDQYFNFLLGKGYQVVSIDYRLGLKGVKDPAQFPVALANSIGMAVEDLFDATNYIINNAEEWSINPDFIIPTGSSAGAITVLHGEYSIANKDDLSKKLPDNFNYAGIIAFAGAIFSHTGDMEWKTSPVPIQLFHGDADRNVPFDKIEAMNMGFYGSKYIAGKLDKIQSPYYFYEVENAAHEIASTPMQVNLNEINAFLEQMVIGKQPLIINTTIEQIGKPEMQKKFELMDYIKANIGE